MSDWVILSVDRPLFLCYNDGVMFEHHTPLQERRLEFDSRVATQLF